MRDLLVLNFDCLSSPTIAFQGQDEPSSSKDFGCGLGWYPNDASAAAVVKGAHVTDPKTFLSSVTNWSSFRSTTFFCQVLGHSNYFSQHNIQPFTRSFVERDWTFMHQGEVDREALSAHIQDLPFLKTIGRTDAELVFCYLMQVAYNNKYETLCEFSQDVLQQACNVIDSCGATNFTITDSTTVIVYHGKAAVSDFYYARLVPPYLPMALNSDTLQLMFNDARDQNRTTLLFSTMAFADIACFAMSPGQMIIARRGDIVTSNMDLTTEPVGGSISRGVVEKEAIHQQQAIQQAQSQGQAHSNILTVKSMTETRSGETLAYRTYELIHRSHYQYNSPVEYSTHTFRLQPVEDFKQEVSHAAIEMSVDGELLNFEDVFGNQSVHYTIQSPYTELAIVSRSQIKIYGTEEDNLASPLRRASIPLVWMPWQRQMMLPYLLPQELPETQLLELTEYAMSFVERNEGHLFSTLIDMNQQIHKDYMYMPGHTSLQTTPFEVFHSRKGVCQDFANLFICLARLLSVPARYRMGYIYTSADYENQIQADASHAWAEVYLPYIGWRGFDPTNGCLVNQDHVRVACGRNYVDATPISGTLYRGGESQLSVDVQLSLVS